MLSTKNSTYFWPKGVSQHCQTMRIPGQNSVSNQYDFKYHVECSFFRRGTALSRGQVIEIFCNRHLGQGSRLGAAIARNYGVTPKAVRDIWKGRTWTDVTSNLCFEQPSCETEIQSIPELRSQSKQKCRSKTAKAQNEEMSPTHQQNVRLSTSFASKPM